MYYNMPSEKSSECSGSEFKDSRSGQAIWLLSVISESLFLQWEQMLEKRHFLPLTTNEREILGLWLF